MKKYHIKYENFKISISDHKCETSKFCAICRYIYRVKLYIYRNQSFQNKNDWNVFLSIDNTQSCLIDFQCSLSTVRRYKIYKVELLWKPEMNIIHIGIFLPSFGFRFLSNFVAEQLLKLFNFAFILTVDTKVSRLIWYSFHRNNNVKTIMYDYYVSLKLAYLLIYLFLSIILK